VKTNHPNEKPDKAGSRAARTAHFSAMLIAWRTRNGLTRRDAARILCCTARTVSQWERRRALPQGVTLTAITAAIEGGTI